MADQAHIGSIDDIARFRAALLTFLSGARVAVEECASDVSRQQSWIDLDRRKHWEGEAWRRQRKLDEARQNLFRESLSADGGPSSFHQMQLHRAEHALDEARAKLERIRGWSRNFENRSLPMVKQVEQLHTVLSVDMAKAVNFLGQSLAALDAYAARPPAPRGPAAAEGATDEPSDRPDPAPEASPAAKGGITP